MNLSQKIINKLIKNGKKQKSEKIFKRVIKNLQKYSKKNPSDIIKLALLKAAPSIKLKEIKRRRRKTKKFLPFVLNEKDRINESLGYVIKNRYEKHSIEAYLSLAFVSAAKKDIFVKKRKKSHEEALAKKKYSNYRWFF